MCCSWPLLSRIHHQLVGWWLVRCWTPWLATLTESAGSRFSYVHLLFRYLYWELHRVLSSASRHLDNATGWLRKVARSSIRALQWVLRAAFPYVLTGTGGAVGGIPHASHPDCVGRGRDTLGVVIKMNVLWSTFPCHANWAALNIAWSCLMSKAEWIVKQSGLKDPAKDYLENHRIPWSLLWMSKQVLKV